MQHCTALKKSREKTIAIDCPHTGKGEEFSPANLVEAGLGGCILISMGTYAMQHGIDLNGAKVEVQISSTDKPVMRFDDVEVIITLPEGISEKVAKRLERATNGCPIKNSFAKEIPVRMQFRYAEHVPV